jgi:hypothetical protein
MLSHVSIEVATCFFSCIFKFNHANDKKDRHTFFSNFKAFYCDIINIYSCNCLSCFVCDHVLTFLNHGVSYYTFGTMR